MAKRIEIDNSQIIKAMDEIIAKANEASRAVSGIGQGIGVPGSNLSGTFTTAAAPGVNPATGGSVGMSAGQAFINPPASVSPGGPSAGVFGPGFGTGTPAGAAALGSNAFGGMGIPGVPANVGMPDGSDYDWRAPSGSAPNQPSWGADQQFGFVRAHFRRFPGQAGGGPASTLSTASTGGGFGGGGAGGGGGGMDDGADTDDASGGGGAGGGRGRRGAGSNSFGQYMSFRTYRELARSVTDFTNEYTRYTISGESNPLAFGNGAGQLIGGALGLGLLMSGVGAPIAGAVGVIAGPLAGAGINAFQAQAIQRQQIATSFATYAGTDNPLAMASGAARIASQQNEEYFRSDFDARTSSGNPFQRAWGYLTSNIDNYRRRWGMHAGVDQISAQDAASIEGSVGHAAEASGVILTPQQLDEQSRYFTQMGGPLGKARASLYDRARTGFTAVGENLFSLTVRYGIDAVKQLVEKDNMQADLPGLAASAYVYGKSQEQIAGEDSTAAGTMSAYDRTAFSGKSTFARRADFDRAQDALRDAYNLKAETYNKLQAGPGRDGPEAKDLFSRAQSDLTQLDRNVSQRSESIVGEISAAGRANLASANYSGTLATLFGSPADIGRAGDAEFATLTDTAKRLQGSIGLPGQTAEQRANIQATVSTMSGDAIAKRTARRDEQQRKQFLFQDVNVAVFAADVLQAQMQGTDADYFAVTDKAIAGQDFIANDALQASRVPGISDQQKAADIDRNARARNNSLTMARTKREYNTALIRGRAGVAETLAGNALTAAQYGDEGDILRAGRGLVQAFANENAQLLAQKNLSPMEVIARDQQVAANAGTMARAQIANRDTIIGMTETRANLANQAAENELNRALKLGGGSDVRGAAGGMLQALGSEAGKLQAQLDQGGLTFDQRAGIQQRLQTISRQAFDVGQDTIDQGFAKDDMSGFGIDSVRNSTARAIAQLMPFGGGNRLTANVNTIRTDMTQLGVLQRREAALRESGNLSPERAYQLAQQEGQLGVEIASGYSNLSERMENYLPALSAGRGANYRMYDSMQLAALRYRKVGSPIRSSGAINGAQNTEQAAVWNALAGDSIPDHPMSRTSFINNGGGEQVALLSQILSVLQRMGSGSTGSSQRLGEGAGQAMGQLGQRDVGTGFGGRKF